MLASVQAAIANPPQLVLLAEHFLAAVVLLKGVGALRRQGVRGVVQSLAGSILSAVKVLPGAAALVAKEQQETLEKIEEFVLGNDDEAEELMLSSLPAKGWTAEEIDARFEALMARKATEFNSGRAFGGVYHALGDGLHTVQCSAYAKFCDTNALYPGIFPGVRKFEAEVVSMVTDMLNGAEGCCASLTSGGTESVLLMAKAYRDHYCPARGIEAPEFIAAASAHACIDKACEYLGITLVRVPVADDQRLDVAAVRAAVTPNTIGIYASAPTFPHGVIDPIEELAAIASEHGVGLHVDNCIGGFLLSALQRTGRVTRKWDFSVPGVTSISTDVHKYGLAQKGCSVIAYRTPALRRAQYTTVTDWAGGLYGTATVQGSRNGGIIAQAWATLAYNGIEKYDASAARIHEEWTRVLEGVRAIDGLRLITAPDACVIAFTGKGLDIYKVADVMEEKGWVVPRLQFPACIHVCVSERMVGLGDAYLADLRSAVEMCRDTPEQVKDGLAGIYGSAAAIPDRSMVGDILKGYLDTLYRVKRA